jgi:hypothetical protein
MQKKWIFFIFDLTHFEKKITTPGVADPDPGSGAFLPQGSGNRNEFFPDPGSRIPNMIKIKYSSSVIYELYSLFT